MKTYKKDKIKFYKFKKKGEEDLIHIATQVLTYVGNKTYSDLGIDKISKFFKKRLKWDGVFE